MDCFTGLYAGFAIFSVLGYMKERKCVADFKDVVAGGPSLAFIAYPEGSIIREKSDQREVMSLLSFLGISMIKAVPPLWSVLFFIMMLALGFGSEVRLYKVNL